MGSIVGSLIGVAGSLIGGKKAAGGSSAGAQQSLEGFNYLKGPQGVQGYVDSGNQANQAQANLLGVGGDPTKQNAAFQNYLGSTGYGFQMKQGQEAVTGSNAAKGILNSGATAKALTTYGQGLASQSFNNYLSNLGNVSSQGLQAAGEIGSAGTTGGGNAGQLTAAAGQQKGASFANAAGQLGNTVSNFFAPKKAA